MACSSSSSLVLTAINATLEDQSFRTRSEVAADALKFWTATCIPYVKKKQCSIPTLGQANLISSFASPPACTPDIPHQKSLWASLVLGRSRTRDTPLRFDHVRLTCLGRSTSGRSLCFCSRAQLF